MLHQLHCVKVSDCHASHYSDAIHRIVTNTWGIPRIIAAPDCNRNAVIKLYLHLCVSVIRFNSQGMETSASGRNKQSKK